ncbi:ATP-binding protein [Actinacidiphila paucisporea]|uniref:Anti-sigma regulatory factor (Ser/Thr protein kinase) n=1 Tax=Actinacidiphila paucisporea TaxID=310782 RepID=A0A1M7LPU2_9ACTN|nr:ATP-binding protein [Actinacidiphila paucisporea]SHM80123.1 Anti-sigma regulatory factor (Ser/Thr protein kinase) [Actinacidiphila paucisporea]
MTERPFLHAPTPAGPTVLLHSRAAYDHPTDSIAVARGQARDFLRALAGTAVILSEQAKDDVLLVVSELVTNAGRHADGPVLLDLAWTGSALDVAVWDTGTAIPVRMPRDPSRIGGHGLEIVAGICSRLHAEQVVGGKRVVARIELASRLR